MISAVVLAKNEEKNISDCLESIRWCNQIIVIDDDSTDNTRIIAQRFGAKVYQRSLNNDFSSQRNYGIAKATNKWILFVDADERVTTYLANEIQKKISKKELSSLGGFYLKRQDFFGGRWLRYGETAQVKLLRLGKKGTGKWQRKVHETWEVKGKTETLKNPLLHYPHQNLDEFISQINYYSSLHAEALFEKKTKSNLLCILCYPLGKFFSNWIWKRGFLDSTPGVIMALMMSFHSFLARAKLYLDGKNN